MALHLIKLCVGCDTVEDLLNWREQSSSPNEPWILRTRQTPKRAVELTAGGSLYRVFKGFILARQRMLVVTTTGDGSARRCEIILDQEVFHTAPTPRRAFQGWRYLEPKDAPPDIAISGSAGPFPVDLARQLRELGAW